VAPPVVTISAPYGAGGPIVGRTIAERLGVPFLDRAIPTAVAQTLAVSLDEAQAHDERADTRVGRMLSALAVSGLGFGPTPEPGVPPQAFREQTERVITSAARTTGCVVLGRAAVIVLRDHPFALHTCLNGPLERRVRQAISLSTEDDDEAAVRKLVEETDRNRKAYFRHFYSVDPDDPSLYHVTLDSTVLDLDTCAEFIATAARARSESNA
jgi:cytidylate kinase